MIKSDEFSDIEFRSILIHAHQLFKHGYFTGINFIKSNEQLPNESILVHFLQDSEIHIGGIVSKIRLPYKITPRFTLFILDPQYKYKKDFKDEYKNSIFYDENFNVVSVEEIIEKEYLDLKITNDELDLIIPCKDIQIRDVILEIQKADREGPFPWRDPVIIIKTKHFIETVPNFKNNMYYISVSRDKEEFYTIVHENSKAIALRKYISKLCKEIKIGDLNEKSITFNLSQINKEFFDYIVRNLRPFEPL